MSDAPPLVLAYRQDHEPLPAPKTYKRIRDSEPVENPQPWDFPLSALCKTCAKMIRKGDSLFDKWEHLY